MLQSWRPRKGVGLSSADMAKLVAALGLEEVHRGPEEETDYGPSEGIMQGDPASQFMAWLHEMNARVQELSERVERLENERMEQERPDPYAQAPSHAGTPRQRRLQLNHLETQGPRDCAPSKQTACL